MGACARKPIVPQNNNVWDVNPANFIDKLGDICCICHEEFTSDFCFAQCCKHFFHVKCLKEYHLHCKNNEQKILCPLCRTNTKSLV